MEEIMNKYIITTESGSDIPHDLTKKHGVYVVPMHIVMDGVDYLDGDLPVPEIFEFYEKTYDVVTFNTFFMFCY